MGRFADIYDQGEDRYWTFVYEGAVWPSPRPSSPRHDCAFCTRSFGADDALQTHLFNEHKPEGFFLRINGRIVAADEPVIEGFIASLEVIPVGYEAFSCTVLLPGESDPWPFSSERGSSVDITRHLDLRAETGLIEIVGHIRGATSKRLVHVLTAPEADLESLDERVLECQEPLFGNRESHWRQLRDMRQLSPTEARYAEGFAAYLLACDLEANGDWASAKRPKELAFEYLRSFRTSLARDVIGILAFRMHAFAILADRSAASLFQPAVKFFAGTHVARPSTRGRKSHPGIWIDDFQDGVLTAVEQAEAGDPGAALIRAESLPAHLLNEPGNSRKRNLLLARLYAASSQHARATGYFRELLNDPYYSSEAAEYLRAR